MPFSKKARKGRSGHILHCEKKICHLELTLGASSPNILFREYFSQEGLGENKTTKDKSTHNYKQKLHGIVPGCFGGFCLYAWMARRFATRIGAIRTNRFARIDAQKKNIITFRAIRANRLNLRFAFLAPRNAIRKNRGSVWEPCESIRTNRAF